MNWFSEYRLNWIAETLNVFGFINRKHIERKFGISVAQAAIDLREFQKRHPNRMAYDKNSKCYRVIDEVRA